MSQSLRTKASSINRALDQIGDKWCLIILQEILWGVRTFGGLLKASGMSKGVLSDRLKWLQDIDCLNKVTPADNPRRPTYHLTKKSTEIYPVALMATAWENRFFHTEGEPRLVLFHSQCEQYFTPELCCLQCNKEVKSKDVSYQHGPGFQLDDRAKKVRRKSSIITEQDEFGNTPYLNLVNIIGDRWTANIIALAYHGFKRFDQFHAELPIATNVLSDRLKFLANKQIFIPVPYQEKPIRYNYYLSEKGLAMFPFFISLLYWGDKWCSTEDGPPVIPHHDTCGADLIAEVRCNKCQQKIDPRDVKFEWVK
jgi:DNA-binding HxlR family transcriptional regulator